MLKFFLIGLFVDRFELSNTRFELLILVLESTTVPTVLLCSLLFLLITDDINYVFFIFVSVSFLHPRNTLTTLTSF